MSKYTRKDRLLTVALVLSPVAFGLLLYALGVPA